MKTTSELNVARQCRLTRTSTTNGRHSCVLCQNFFSEICKRTSEKLQPFKMKWNRFKWDAQKVNEDLDTILIQDKIIHILFKLPQPCYAHKCYFQHFSHCCRWLCERFCSRTSGRSKSNKTRTGMTSNVIWFCQKYKHMKMHRLYIFRFIIIL